MNKCMFSTGTNTPHVTLECDWQKAKNCESKNSLNKICSSECVCSARVCLLCFTLQILQVFLMSRFYNCFPQRKQFCRNLVISRSGTLFFYSDYIEILLSFWTILNFRFWENVSKNWTLLGEYMLFNIAF